MSTNAKGATRPPSTNDAAVVTSRSGHAVHGREVLGDDEDGSELLNNLKTSIEGIVMILHLAFPYPNGRSGWINLSYSGPMSLNMTILCTT